jgi:autotransporter passenger strand-loop-strand repeat protein
VRGGGRQTVLGGTASGTQVSSGGVQIVSSGLALSATLVSGGVQSVTGSGIASATQLASGAEQVVGSGGTAIATNVASGATLLVSGGIASGAVLSAGGVEVISAGTDVGATLASGAVQSVTGSGATVGTLVSGGGLQIVLASATTTGTVLGSGAEQLIEGGTASGTVVSSGGTQELTSGSTISSIVQDGGTEIISGGVASCVIVEPGATLLVEAGTIDCLRVSSGGFASVFSGASGMGPLVVDGGGTLALGAGALVSGAVPFGLNTGSGALLQIGGLAGFSGTIGRFGNGDSIDLTGLAVASAGSASVAGDLLSVTEGTITDTLTLSPLGYYDASFSAVSDGAGGTLVTVQIPCFAQGTRVATPRGAVAVDALRVGDPVCLAEGGTAPVAWLGHRAVAPRRHGRPADLQPVRIAAHAFGLGRPDAELLLSPDHAVWVDGVLIPIRYLLNDATVRQLDVARVTYWHVELPAHGVLLAEGLPCESYLDTGNRASFANGGAVAQAHPDFARDVRDRRGCAPLVTAGPARDHVYRQLLAQALLLGWRTADAGAAGVTWIAPAEAAA